MTDTAAAPCERCPLEPTRAVASRGPVPARLLLLSGAPRYHEERDGVAFASPAFARLEQTLTAAGLDPAGVHYATLTGCRPPYQRPIRGEEIAACGPRLDLAINAVAPQVIVLCGADAVAALLPGVSLSTEHGRLVARGRRRYYPIRHPYAALHDQRYVDEVEADLRHLAALLAAGRLDSEAPLAASAPAMLATAGTATQPTGAAVAQAARLTGPESADSLSGDGDVALVGDKSRAAVQPVDDVGVVHEMSDADNEQLQPDQMDSQLRLESAHAEQRQPPDAAMRRQSRVMEAPPQQAPDDSACDQDDAPAQLSLF